MTNMEQLTTKLNNVPETMLIPLRARYLETKTENGIINDPKSVEILDRIDFNINKKGEVSKGTQIGTSIRTEILDEQTIKFLNNHPDGIVVNMGCGLDTRFHRLDNGKVTWFDIDLPVSIELRKNFFTQTERFRFISKSIFDYSWIELIPKNKPMLFIAEGLLMYFEEEKVKTLFATIKGNFCNSEILFEAMSPFVANNSKRNPDLKNYNAEFKWGIKTGAEIDAWNLGIKFINEWYYFDRYKNRIPTWMKLLLPIPSFRKMMKIVHCKI